MLLGIFAAVSPPASADPPTPLDAQAILDRVDDLFRADSAHGRMRMTVRTEHWERSLELEFWSKGRDRSLLRILAPRKEEGTATLRVGTDLWNYLPKVDRVIKLPSSMMSGSWMGSHFTNDDLVKESRMVDEYDFALGYTGERAVPAAPEEGAAGFGPAQDRQVVEVVCTPKADAAVVWGRVEVDADPDTWLPLMIRYFDEDLDPSRTLVFWDLRDFGEHRVPARMRMVPADKPNEYTEVVYEAIEFDVDLADDLFSIRSLRR